MSRQATVWAVRQSPPKSSDKTVLWALADACNCRGWEAWPSVAAIATFAILNRKQVIQCLDRLERAGVIADTGQRV